MNEQSDGQHHQHPPRRGLGPLAWTCIIAGGLVLLAVLYVLGLGPAVWLHESLSGGPDWPRHAIETIYAPLAWWHEQDMPGAGVLGAYVQWWDELAGRP